MKRLMMATAMVFALAGPVRADLQSGLDAYYHEDYATALSEIRPLAESGDAKAQYRLGMMFDFGQGVQKDPAEGARWLRLSALQGDPEAQFALGMKYENGYGVPFSPAEAWWWMRKAANQGYFDALNWLVNSGECAAC